MTRIALAVLATISFAACGGGGGREAPPFTASENVAESHAWLNGIWVGTESSSPSGPFVQATLQLQTGQLIDQSRLTSVLSGDGNVIGHGTAQASDRRVRGSFQSGQTYGTYDLVAAPDFGSLAGTYELFSIFSQGAATQTGWLSLSKSLPASPQVIVSVETYEDADVKIRLVNIRR